MKFKQKCKALWLETKIKFNKLGQWLKKKRITPKTIFKWLLIGLLSIVGVLSVLKGCSKTEIANPKQQNKMVTRYIEDLEVDVYYSFSFEDLSYIENLGTYEDYEFEFEYDSYLYYYIRLENGDNPRDYLLYFEDLLFCTIIYSDSYNSYYYNYSNNFTFGSSFVFKTLPTSPTLSAFFRNNLSVSNVGGDCPPCEIPWTYDGSFNKIYKPFLYREDFVIEDITFTNGTDKVYIGLVMWKGVLSYELPNETETIATWNAETKEWDFTNPTNPFIIIQNVRTEKAYNLFKANERHLQEIKPSEYNKFYTDLGIEVSQTLNNSILNFFTQLVQLPYNIFTTLFAPFNFNIGGINFNLGTIVLGLLMLLLIIWIARKFK